MIIVGILAFLLSIPLILKAYWARETFTHGYPVEVVITRVPNDGGMHSRDYFITFEYNRKKYVDRVGSHSFHPTEFHVGDSLKMIYSAENDEFLYAGENPSNDYTLYFLIGILWVCGAILFRNAFKGS